MGRSRGRGADFCSAILSLCLARLTLHLLSLSLSLPCLFSGASCSSISSTLLPQGCPALWQSGAQLLFLPVVTNLGESLSFSFLSLLSPGLLSLYWPASLPGPLALASPALPLILSLRQPPSCGPEDDVQLQLALSLSREEHDKVRVASLPLPGLSQHLAQLRGLLPHVPEVPPLYTVCSLPALSQQL